MHNMLTAHTCRLSHTPTHSPLVLLRYRRTDLIAVPIRTMMTT